MNAHLAHMTPGEILLEDYMKPMRLTQNALARALGVPPRRVNEIVHGKRAVTLDTSLRLGRYFGQSPSFWLNVQTECDLRKAKKLLKRVAHEVRPKAKLENTVHQHHPDRASTPKEVLALKKQEEAADAASASASD